MAKIFPFRGLRYSASVPIDKVVTQPYDKISPEMQDRYYQLHPNNIIRIILGKSSPAGDGNESVYTRAAGHLKEWRDSGVLEVIPSPSVFAYFQRFTVPGTNEVRVRKGFVAAGQLEDYANKVVYPHERTLTGPKKDRLELLRATKTQFEQIFMLYEDPEQKIDRALDEVSQGRPDVEIEDEYGVQHTIWTVSDPAVLEMIQREMADKKLIIADGHHRYETALAYRDERRKQAGKSDANAAYERIPMTLFNMNSPGLTILPTHRVVSNLGGFDSGAFFQRAAEFFDVVEAPAEAEALRAALKSAGADRITIGVTTDGGKRQALLRLKPDFDRTRALPDVSENLSRLDVLVLHRLLIEKCLGITEDAVKKESNITYVREMEKALRAVGEGKAQIAFLLNPTRIDHMRNVAYEGNVMPQKSTDFYPKVLSGLTIYPVD